MQPLHDQLERHRKTTSDEPRRLLHGRGRTIAGYEFLVIDWYPPVIVVTLYASVERSWLEHLQYALEEHFGDRLEGIVVQDRSSREAEPLILAGTVPAELIIREAGLRYRIEPLASQNIGFFPDMQAGRQLVREIAAGKKVLNLFAYTCGFSVTAIAGGATTVVNLDMNRNLLNRGRENHRLNGHDLRNVSFEPHDLFKSFGRLKKLGPFDLAIIDPPYRQGASFRAERDWPKILRRMPELLTPSGEMVAAVSAPELGRAFLEQQFASMLPGATLLASVTAGDDFPEADPDKGLQIQHYRLNTA